MRVLSLFFLIIIGLSFTFNYRLIIGRNDEVEDVYLFNFTGLGLGSSMTGNFRIYFYNESQTIQFTLVNWDRYIEIGDTFKSIIFKSITFTILNKTTNGQIDEETLESVDKTENLTFKKINESKNLSLSKLKIKFNQNEVVKLRLVINGDINTKDFYPNNYDGQGIVEIDDVLIKSKTKETSGFRLEFVFLILFLIPIFRIRKSQ